jgi:hypothetical protein
LIFDRANPHYYILIIAYYYIIISPSNNYLQAGRILILYQKKLVHGTENNTRLENIHRNPSNIFAIIFQS